MILISYSGGKDSNAMLLYALEKGLDFIAVYQDTGFEHSLHYDYMDYVSKHTGVEIVRIKNDKYSGLIDMVEKKMMIPNRVTRFCTDNLKTDAVKQYILARGDITENWVGVRTQESAARASRYGGLTYDDTFPLSDFPNFSKRDFGHIDCRLPVVDWTEKMVWDIHEKHGLKKNPLYDLGAKRVGCYPCVMSSDASWRNVWKTEEGKRNIYDLNRLEKLVNKEKGDTSDKLFTFRSDYRTIESLIDRFRQMDRQTDMFSEDSEDNASVACSWCHG